MPVTLSGWLIGGGSAVAALGVVIGLFGGVLNPIDLILLLVLIGIVATVFLSANYAGHPHQRLMTLVIVLIGFGTALTASASAAPGWVSCCSSWARLRRRSAPSSWSSVETSRWVARSPDRMTLAPPPAEQRHGLTETEYDSCRCARTRAQRVELGMFGAMWWSTAATSTRGLLLGRLPSTGDRVLVGPGENAGAIDIGDGLAVVFKVESHNHPSAVEPYQGAATGVGGIIRDIFTMGARPIALLNSLRFGPLEPGAATDATVAARNRYLFGGVVGGIAGYGNCIGIPTSVARSPSTRATGQSARQRHVCRHRPSR